MQSSDLGKYRRLEAVGVLIGLYRIPCSLCSVRPSVVLAVSLDSVSAGAVRCWLRLVREMKNFGRHIGCFGDVRRGFWILIKKLITYSLRPKISDVLASRETTIGNYILKYINIYAK